MSEETIRFYQQLFEQWVQKQENKDKSIQFSNFFQAQRREQIYKKFGCYITYDICAYQAIMKAIAEPKLMHFSKEKPNGKRNKYRQIIDNLFQQKFILKGQKNKLIQKMESMESEQNWIKTGLNKFMHYMQVNGAKNIPQQWQISMNMSFLIFWQAIKINKFYSKILVPIFGCLRNNLKEDQLQLAKQCLEKVKKSKITQFKYQGKQNQLDQSNQTLATILFQLSKDQTGVEMRHNRK